MKAMGKVTLILGLMIIVSLFLTSCSGVVTPEISMGNSNNPSSNNPNSNNYQDPSTDPVEETVIVATGEPATVEVDITKPVITGLRDPLPNSFGWNNTDVTVSFSCEDVGPIQSGIETNTVAGMTVTTEGKDQSVTNTGTCIDAAGNVADSVTVSNINIDKTPPVVTITLPKNGKYGLNESVTATWSATDALSGVVSPVSGTVSIDTSSVGTKIFTLPAGTAKDKAGNSSLKVTKSYSVIADTEEPAEEPGTVYPQKWATGTGTVGDPWANSCIESAYTACPVGGTIFLRAGYYQLAGVLTIKKTVNIIGEGMGNTIILTADAIGLAIGGSADYITLEGFTVDGNAQSNTSGLRIINVSSGSDYIGFKNIEAKNGGYTAINLFEVNNSSFQNIYVHDNYYTGFHSGSDKAGRNKDNTYQDIYCWNNGNNGFDDRGKSIAPLEQLNNIYDNIQCWGNGSVGIAIGLQKGGVVSNSLVTENVDGYYGLYLYNVEDFNFTNVIVRNNGTGIRIEDCSNLTFTSCQSYDDRVTLLQNYGIELDGTCAGISVLNCKLSPNKIGEIYNPNGAVITVTTEKMLAKF